MTSLVTGAAGFIGSHLLETLAARGDDVRGVDSFNDYYDPARKRENADGLDVLEADLLDTDLDALLQGVEMVRRQFLAKLEGFGVRRIEAEQQRFDPALHEAISSVPAASPDQDGMVVGTVRSGYRIGDDVLRPAAVAVAKHAGAGATG